MYDVCIIGRGPAGVSAAIYLARAGKQTVVVSKDGGALEKADVIENYYGFSTPVKASELAAAGVAQAKALDDMGVKIDGVIDIEVSDSDIMKRLGGRRLCGKCGASYHTEYKPCTVDGICDKCGGELVIRADDKPEVIESRLAVYHEQTEPLKDYYAERGVLKTVIGKEKIEDTTALTLAAIESIRG